MALGGIWMLYNGEEGATLSVAGTALVFLSSLSYAVYLVYINRSGLGKVPTSVVTFYVLLFGWGAFRGDGCLRRWNNGACYPVAVGKSAGTGSVSYGNLIVVHHAPSIT